MPEIEWLRKRFNFFNFKFNRKRPLFWGFFLMALKFTKHNLTSPGDSASMLHICHLKIPHFPRRFLYWRQPEWAAVVCADFGLASCNTQTMASQTLAGENTSLSLMWRRQTDEMVDQTAASVIKVEPRRWNNNRKETLWRQSHRHTRAYTHLYRSGRLYLNTQSNTWVKERWLWVSVDCCSRLFFPRILEALSHLVSKVKHGI